MTRKDGNQGYFSVALASSDSREVGNVPQTGQVGDTCVRNRDQILQGS